jgi:hypothetical protein
MRVRVEGNMKPTHLNTIGMILAIAGSSLSLVGALVNNLLLDSHFSMQMWAISNPIFLAYFIGNDKGYWNGQHVSKRALILTYAVFTATTYWGLYIAT